MSGARHWNVVEIRDAMSGDVLYARDEESQWVPLPPILEMAEPDWENPLVSGGEPGRDIRAGIESLGLGLADRARAAQLFWAATAEPGEVHITELRRELAGAWRLLEVKVLDLRHQEDIGVILISIADAGACDQPRVSSHFGARGSEGGAVAYFERPRWFLIEIDGVGSVLDADGEVSGILGRDAASLSGRSLIEYVHPDDHVALLEMWGGLLAEPGGSRTARVRVLRPNGTERWIEASVLSRFDASGTGSALVVAHDITERRRRERDLRSRAIRDGLTGMPNRRAIEYHLAELLSVGSATVAFVDLDGFKWVNDTFGHLAGDEVLETVGGRLVAGVHATAGLEMGLAGRWGGDEFVLLSGGEGRSALLDLVRGALEDPVEVGAITWQPRASCGIAVGGRGADPQVLISEADSAMYDIKERRRVGS